MKKLVLVLFLFAINITFCQVFYKGTDEKDFKEMLKNGVAFIPSGFGKTDAAFISALQDNWKVSSFKVLDLKETELMPNQIVLTLSVVGAESSLSLINSSYLMDKNGNRRGASKYDTIGYICVNGFNQTANQFSMIDFSQQIIKGLNDALQTIKDNDIRKSGVGLYKTLYNKTLSKAKVLQSKTLLIIGGTQEYVDLKALTKHGINYKLISSDNFEEMEKKELSNYCLMYFAYNSYTEISIYDLENNDLIYTRHFASAKREFSSGDISDISKLWK